MYELNSLGFGDGVFETGRLEEVLVLYSLVHRVLVLVYLDPEFGLLDADGSLLVLQGGGAARGLRKRSS